MKKLLILAICCITATSACHAQIPFNRLPQEGKWITAPGANPNGYGVYYFRKDIRLTEVPQNFKIRITADNRYILYVNGQEASLGPARGDIKHWNYETVDIVRLLKTGNNVIAAEVWNEGSGLAGAAFSCRTALMIDGTGNSDIADTNDSWFCMQDKAYSPLSVNWGGYIAVCPGETVDMHKHVAEWKDEVCDSTQWQHAEMIAIPVYKNKGSIVGEAPAWQLVPSALPQTELSKQRIARVRLSNMKLPKNFPAEKTNVTIPANTNARLLLDNNVETNAYLSLVFSRGNDATISVKYQESLYNTPSSKGNRNDVAGKFIAGRKDSIISNGKDCQNFTTLFWRTYRYIQIDVCTKKEPLVINDIYGTFTGFPFTLKAKLDTKDTELQKIFETGWRTARLCAGETYMDCPYYEQMQYLGDTRIQALISLFDTGDDRLVKKFLNMADLSREVEGLTESRYPAHVPQFIPGYSLIYICSLHDYMMYGGDNGFVKDKLSGMSQILQYFKKFQKDGGCLENLPWWNFTDWVDGHGWNIGTAPKGKDGCSAPYDLQLLMAYQAAADLEHHLGTAQQEDSYRTDITRLKKAIQDKYWDAGRGLYADDSEHTSFSQHTNALAIITEMATGNEANKIGQKLTTDKSLAPASLYFSFYVQAALTKAGFGDDYLSWLGIWRENLRQGLTTWAETSDIDGSRSDCHAWGASPNIELFRIVLGINSDAPAFAKVRIEPHLGTLKDIGGEMPHPQGMIKTHYQINKGILKAVIQLPESVTGVFVWKGKENTLHGGQNEINMQ